LKTLLSKRIPAGWERPRPQPRSTLSPETDRDAIRREILALALSDVLRRHGLPLTWITAHPQRAAAGGRERGMHLFLTIREWEPALLARLVAIERQVRIRTLRLDPFSRAWLAGISWRFELVDESRCPPLPDPAYWATQGIRTPSAEGRGEAPRLADTARPAFLPTQPL
jgi:hypothetical protein